MKHLFLIPSSLALVLTLAACKSEPDPQARTPEVVSNVTVVKSETVRLPDTVSALGTIRATQSAQLAAQIMGTITAVHVREGDAVKHGQLLVTVDPAQAQAGLERAQSALSAAQHDLAAARSDRDLADSTFKRYTTLYERKSVSPQEYDEVKARVTAAASRADSSQDAVAQAKAALAQAQAVFDYTRIKAPFDGIVTARQVDPGAIALPGTPILTVESTGSYRAEVTVDERNLRFVQLGHEVPVSIDAYPNEQITGKVVQIVPSADTSSRTFLVKIALPLSPILRSGLSATANFSRGTRDAVVIPQTAVVNRGALKGIYVVGNDGIATLRYVTPGTVQKDRLEILSGITENERVVATPEGLELAGKKIEVQ